MREREKLSKLLASFIELDASIQVFLYFPIFFFFQAREGERRNQLHGSFSAPNFLEA